MRVLICSPPTTAVGGIAQHTRLLLQHVPGAELFDQWWPLSDRGSSRPVRLGVHALALARLAGRLILGRPDVLHLQVSQPGLGRDSIYNSMARVLDVPVVAHLHSEFLVDEVPDLRPIVASAARVVVLSDAIRARIVDFFPAARGRVSVLRNPVAPEFTSYPAPDRDLSGPTTVLMVGVLSALKNQVAVARVVENLRESGTDIRLMLAGPPAADFAPTELEFLQSCSGTTLLGQLDRAQLREILDRSDALVLYSTSEGEPLVVLEAMARGLPVIASDVGSLRELLPEQPHNIVVAPDEDHALAEGLLTIVRDRAHLETTGSVNHDFVIKHRTLEAHLEGLGALYFEVTDAALRQAIGD